MKLPTRFARTALPWWCLVTMLATAAAMVRAMQGPPSEFDEGFIVTGALQMLHGGLPIRDFFVIYGPGQYSLTAAVFALFGETIFNARVLHVVVLALLGATLVALAGVLTDAANQRRWPWLALVALGYVLMTAHVLPGPGYAALPATLLLLWASLAVAAATAQAAAGQWGAGRLLKASVLLGLAGVMRWDFGVYGLLAAGATMLMSSAAQGRSRGEILRALALTAGPALAILLLVFTPLIVLGGAARWWDEVPRFHLLEFKVWRNLDFFTPALTDAWAALQAHDRWALSRAVLKLVYAALPMSVGSVVAAGGPAVVAARARPARRGCGAPNAPWHAWLGQCPCPGPCPGADVGAADDVAVQSDARTFALAAGLSGLRGGLAGAGLCAGDMVGRGTSLGTLAPPGGRRRAGFHGRRCAGIATGRAARRPPQTPACHARGAATAARRLHRTP